MSISTYPHECGEHLYQGYAVLDGDGSSPRMWGTCGLVKYSQVLARFIPTNVGNMDCDVAGGNVESVHPHECGEHPYSNEWEHMIDGSSPRMWGTSVGKLVTPFLNGSSPRMWGTSCHRTILKRNIRFIPTNVGNI